MFLLRLTYLLSRVHRLRSFDSRWLFDPHPTARHRVYRLLVIERGSRFGNEVGQGNCVATWPPQSTFYLWLEFLLSAWSVWSASMYSLPRAHAPLLSMSFRLSDHYSMIKSEYFLKYPAWPTRIFHYFLLRWLIFGLAFCLAPMTTSAKSR